MLDELHGKAGNQPGVVGGNAERNMVVRAVLRCLVVERVCVLNIIDESNLEALALEPGFSIPATRLICVMNCLVDFYGIPDKIRCDNGAEMAGHAFRQWDEDLGV